MHVKSRDQQAEDKSMSEAWIIEAVVCYDFLHNDITKPMHAIGLTTGAEVDPPFRGIKFHSHLSNFKEFIRYNFLF